jgi:hypothetical protein
MFYSDLSNLMEAFLTAYTTFPLNKINEYWNSPAAYLASATKKYAFLHYFPIFCLLSSNAFMTYLNFFFKASAFLLSNSWPFLAAAIFCL